MEKINIQKIKEIADFCPDTEMDIREIYIEAIQEKFRKWIYLGKDEIKVDEDMPIEDEFKRLIYEIIKNNGSFKNFVLKREIDSMKSYLRLTEIDGEVIKGCWYSYGDSYLAFREMMSLYFFIIKNEHLRDYSKVSELFKSLEEDIKNFKEVETEFFRFKPFKNRNVKITFKDKAIAERLFKVYTERKIEGEFEDVEQLAVIYGIKN